MRTAETPHIAVARMWLKRVYERLLDESTEEDNWQARQTVARLINEANNPHLWANWRDLT